MRTMLIVAAGLPALLAAGAASAQARLWDAPGPCNRDCLIEIADDYLAALVAHDPDAAALSDDVRFTENTVVMQPGEGLWQSASAVPERFAIHVPDPVSRQIGFIGMMEEHGDPIQIGLRLKIDDAGRIVEAEHIVVRSVRETSLPNLQVVRPGINATIPQSERLQRELLLAIAMTYYDAIELSDGEASLFADECERRENGMITAGGDGLGMNGLPRQRCAEQLTARAMSYIDSIDLRRVWIADPVTGLVFGLSQFRHSMEDKEIDVYGPDGELTTRVVDFAPFDLPAAHVFKIRDNRIHEIEALGFMMPYLSKNGWNEFLR